MNCLTMKTSLLFSLFFLFSLVVFAQKPKVPIPKGQDYGIMYTYNDSLQYETYPQKDGWGYRLYLRYKLLINQSIIPALVGNKPFKNEADAKRIAKLASSKIAKGQMPPTLEVKEIKKLLNLK
jgi:Domain of unknown function (DUF4907)